MGSCDDPAVIGEPFRGSVTQLVGCSSQPLPKQQSRQEMASCPSNCSEAQMFESDRRLGAITTNICTSSSEPADAGEEGTFRGSEHADTLLLGERLDSDSCVSDPCLNEENDACNLENRTLSSDMKESQDVDGLVGILGCKTTMGMVSLTGSSVNCVKPDELDNNSCVIAASAKVERDDTVDDGPILAQMGTCTDDLESPSHVCEIVSNSASVNGFPSDFIQQNKPDNDGFGCSFSDVADRITDASVEIVADMLNEMSPLQSDQIPSIQVGQSVANYDQYICQMDGKSLSGTSEETVTEVADMNSNPESCLQVLPSQGCQRIGEYLQSDGSLTIPSPESDPCDEKHVSNSSKYIPKVVEEDIDILTYNNGDAGKHVVRKIENDCNLEEATFRVNPNCVELIAFPLPSQPHDFGNDGLSEMLNAEDIPLKDISSVNLCNVGGQDDNDKEKVGCVSEVKCPETVVLSSKRSGRRRTSSQKTVTKRASRKSKKKVPQPLIFDTARKRRSSISRPARPSPWGSLGYIIQSFDKSDNDLVNQSQKQGNKKSKGNQGGSKRNKKQASESSHRSRKGTQGKCATSTNCIRLKVKLGKNAGHNFLNIMVPEVVDSSLSAKGISCNYGNESYWEGNLEFPPLAHGVDDQKPEEGPLRKIFCYNRNQEKEEKCSDASVVKEQCANNDSSCTIIADKPSEKHTDDNHCISSHLVEPVERASDTRSLDPGTSPDSEVINSVLDIQVGAMRQEILQDSVLASSEDFAASGNVTSSKKGRKKAKSCQVVSCSQEGGSSASACRNRSKSSKKHGRRRNVDNQLGSSETCTSTGANVLNYSLNSKELSMEQVPLSTEVEFPEEALKAEGILEVKECCKIDVGSVFSESENSKTLFPSQSERKKHPKISKSVKTSKGKYKAPGSKNNIKNASKERVYQRKSVNKSKIKKAICDQVVTGMESHQVVGNCLVDKPDKSDDIIASTVAVSLNAVQGAVNEQYIPPRDAWVLCDDCHKWRRIPASLVDSLGHASCTWTCKDNVDKAFADCSIPQEKSNAEINAELEISDESGEENASNKRLTYRELGSFHPTTVNAVPQENKFASISSNNFLHRSRKTQTIDEIMVCHCKPALDGRLGCGDECLNRMLNIECVRGTCPCGDLCSNQQFQKRKYAKLRWVRCGKKGYGLQLLDNISKGQFLIEYVGEVLDMHAYEARQKEYALNGHRHFYFMTLNGSEVIDACGKGNLGRFINHSCDPNCRTEKWMVNGEICIGLFALRDIKKGEEVTFDYNYVRVFGAAAKKCYCGSSQCRGYIGGDPLNSEVIIQSDSDEEFPEPVMLRADGRSWNNNLPAAVRSLDGAEMQPSESITGVKDKRDQPTGITVIESKISEEKEDPLSLSASTVSPLHSSLEFEESKVASPAPLLPETTQHTEDVTSKPVFVHQPEISPVNNNSNKNTCSIEQVAKSLFDDIDARKKSKLDAGEDKQVYLRPYPRMKTSRKPGSIKKGKVSSVEKVQMTNKPQISSFKPKRLIEGSPSNRFEAVEETLNELLDAEGGISKRKDAPKGYLKLLLLTAASGASGSGEAIQSNRDLSMILDALLKTKSRVVLTDIINKNGLRMLHNIMKQYRSDFKKIPILRKLLKVLEYLVAREILTSELINGGPPCPGMESLRESLLSLTEHDDKQVHQIARSFRDRWFPRPVRKFGYTEREDGRLEVYRGSNCSRFTSSHSYRHDQDSRPTEAIDCVKQSMPTSLPDAHPADICSVASAGGQSSSGQKTRKRKSRWDQPADTNLDLRSKEQKLESSLVQHFDSSQLNSVGVAPMLIDKVNGDDKDSSLSDYLGVCCRQDEDIRADSAVQNVPEDIPPGFSSPFNPPLASSSPFSTVLDPSRQSTGNLSCAFSTVGHPQERFISRLPVSYGIPSSFVQQYGTSHAENLECWDVAPGVPFHPFPPLPPYPRGEKGPPTSACGTAIRQSAQPGQVNSHDSRTSFSEESTPSTSTNMQQDLCIPLNNQQILKRVKESSYDLGRRYFRQQKWRNTKFGPPWLQRRNQWGYQGNFRGGASAIGDDNVPNEGINPYCSDEASVRVDKANDDFYQHSLNQNQR